MIDLFIDALCTHNRLLILLKMNASARAHVLCAKVSADMDSTSKLLFQINGAESKDISQKRRGDDLLSQK